MKICFLEFWEKKLKNSKFTPRNLIYYFSDFCTKTVRILRIILTFFRLTDIFSLKKNQKSFCGKKKNLFLEFWEKSGGLGPQFRVLMKTFRLGRKSGKFQFRFFSLRILTLFFEFQQKKTLKTLKEFRILSRKWLHLKKNAFSTHSPDLNIFSYIAQILVCMSLYCSKLFDVFGHFVLWLQTVQAAHRSSSSYGSPLSRCPCLCSWDLIKTTSLMSVREN